jgi:hypothetical protein
VARAASFTDWLTAVGGFSAAIATIVLAGLAYWQMRATREQAVITKEAAARQVFPLVYAHDWRGPHPTQGEIEFRYYLTNEGLGPALNVEHGVTVDAKEYVFGAQETGFMFRTIQPGEYLPPRPVGSSDPAPPAALTVRVPKSDLAGGMPAEVIYWCRYETLFGERWETRNSSDPTKSPERIWLDQPGNADSPASVSE